jgi:hypothetical protein
LKTRRAFHTYSFRNQILIATQQPHRRLPDGTLAPTAEHCTRVAGYRQWQRLGYQVASGKGTAIYILAPCKPSKKQLAEAKQNGEEIRMRFRGAAVFDISQTEPIEGKAQPLEAPGRWPELDADSDPDLFADLAKAACDLGVEDVIGMMPPEAPPGAKGVYDPGKQLIWIAAGIGGAQRVEVLVHELAHHVDRHLPGKVTDYAIGELVAESSAFMVCDSLGIDTTDTSAYYVAHWTKDIEDPGKALSAVAGRVLDVTQAIEDALAHVRPGPDDSEPAAGRGGVPDPGDAAVAA